MIDDIDVSESTIRLLASQTLKAWPANSLLKLLEDEDYVVRTLAARELHARQDSEIFDAMFEFSKSGVVSKREICAFVLGQLGLPKMPFKEISLPILASLLADEQPEVRAAAAAGIGHLCYCGMPNNIVEALLNAAEDTNSDVRCTVAYSLGNAIKYKGAELKLMNLLNDPVNEVGEYAQLGLDMLRSSDRNTPDREIKGTDTRNKNK